MKNAYATPILKRLAKRAGVRVNVEPKYGYAGQVVLPSGKNLYFRGTNFDLNSLGASEIAKDKAYATYFMRLMGYPTISGETFFNDGWCKKIGSKRNAAAAWRYAKRIGFPLIVKPNSLSQGVGVAKVHNRKEFFEAVRFISKRDHVFLVQKVARGRDYRIVVLGNKVMSAYERLPLRIVGDGRHTIAELLHAKQKQFIAEGRDTVLDKTDYRIRNNLRRLRLTRRSVLLNGKAIELLESRNLSLGGESVDVTRTMHPSFRKLAVKLVRDMGLTYCGVDVMVQGDIQKPVEKYQIIEVNAAPGIDNYARAGREQKKIVESMYLTVLRAMKRGSR